MGGLQGYKMSAGDKLMLRDNCSEADRRERRDVAVA